MKKKKNHSSYLSEMLPVSAEQTRLSRTEWKRKTQSVFHDIRRQLKKTDLNGDSLLNLTTHNRKML